MRNNIGDKERLGHILERIDYIEKALAGKSREQFEEDFILHTAVVKWFEVIGEASYQLSSAFKKANPIIEWRSIEGLRHVLVHEYFGVDLYKLWELYTTQLPQLKDTIKELYKAFE